MSSDDRIPVRFAHDLDAAPGIPTAWLLADGATLPDGPAEIFAVTAGHAPGCACCLPRGGAAEALRRLFLRRARGEVPLFQQVMVRAGSAAAASVAAALQQDLFVAARFRAG